MKKKVLKKKAGISLDGLAAIVEKGFAAVADDFADMRGEIVDIRNTMATKEDIAVLRAELKGDIAALGLQTTNIERELRGIRGDLTILRTKVENLEGFRLEIDHALERIAAIEKHLGIGRKE